MSFQLTRVQVYLDKENLSLLDNLAKETKISRSKIMRDALDAVTTRYIHLRELIVGDRSETDPIEDLISCGKSKTGKVGLNIDEIYLHD